MVCLEIGDLGVIVQRPVKVTVNEPGRVFLRQTVEHPARGKLSKENSVGHNIAQVYVLTLSVYHQTTCKN